MPDPSVTRGLPTRHWPGVVVAAFTATVTVMPGFAVGALAPMMGPDLHASPNSIGLAMSAFYAATALGSPVSKRVAARLPVPGVLTIASLVASAVMVTISQATISATLMAMLVVGGLSNGLVQPAASRLIAASIPARRRSLAAGTVGAALGAATMVPGLLVAVVLPAHGWRTAMLTAGLVALIPIMLIPLTGGPHRRPLEPADAANVPHGVGRVLVLWALAAALSATGNNAVATYFVQLGTHSGLPIAVAGKLLSLGALLAIAVRLAAGALTDFAPSRNPTVITTMMLAGGLGLALIAITTPVTFVLGATLAFSAGWGWTGLLLATTLRLVPGHAENAGHTVQVGTYAGATAAPFAFGALSGMVGFAGASCIAASAAFAAAAAMTAGTLLLRGAE